MSWDIFSKSKIQYFLEKLKDKFVQKETGKGLSTNDYTTTDKNKVSKIDTTTTSISGNPISISGLKANQLAVNPIITLEPIQDLHGQSKPYPAGGGKNKLLLTVDEIKSYNTSGTWNGNTFTYESDNTITFTILTDNANNVTGIKINGTCHGGHSFRVLASNLTNGTTYCFSGCPANGTTSTYRGGIWQANDKTYTEYGTGTSFISNGGALYYECYIYDGATVNNIVFNPMIEEGSTKTAFAPYSNICPISGYDKIEVLSCGVNIWDEEWEVGSINNRDGQNNNADTNDIRSKNYNIIEPNKSYYNKVVSGYIWIHYYDANKNWISGTDLPTGGGVFTTPNNSNIKYYRIRTTANYGSKYLGGIGINYPATQTSYVASNKTTSISESLGQTVYGATWYPRTGKFTVMFGIVDLGDLTWSYDTQYQRFMALVLNIKQRGARELPFVCSCYECISDSREVYDVPNYAIYSSVAYVYIHDSRYTDATAFKTAVTGQKIAYPVATPFEIQLTPHEISLLSNYAYVSTNGTNISLDYHNGELASLGDVSQLGETVNELGKMVIRHKQVKLSSSVIGTSFSPTSIRIDKLGNLFGADCANQNNILSISVMQINVTPASMLICGHYNDYLWIASNQSCTLTGDAVFNITYIAN